MLDEARDAVTRRQLLRAAGIGGVVVGAPGILAACGSDKSSSTGTAGGTGTSTVTLSNKEVDLVTWPVTLTIDTLDVARADYMIRTHVLATEPVVVRGDDLKIKGHLAESWEQTDDVTYVYKVRQGVKFWDGSPLTAEDLAYAMARHADPKTQSLLAGIMPKVDSIEATGDDEVTVKLSEPNATWPQVPTYMCVGSKKYYEKYGKDFGAATAAKGNVMGTGPYIVERVKSGESIEFVRNESYWGEKPIAKRLTIVTIAESEPRALAAQAGDVDGTFEVDADQINRWKSISNFNVSVEPGANLTFASFDIEKKPFDDVHVRKAFAYAFDREGAINAVLRGNGQVTNSIVPRSQWSGDVSKEKLDEIYNGLPVYDFDLDKAKEELAQSAYPNGVTATIWTYSSSEPLNNMAQAWAANLKKIGVNLKIDAVVDDEGYAREAEHRDLGLSIHDGWTPYYADPIDRPLTVLRSSAAKAGSYNEANYDNSEVDRLIDENLNTSDPAKRADALAQVMKIAQEEVPYIPLWTSSSAVALRDGLGYEGWGPWFESQFWIGRLKSAA